MLFSIIICTYNSKEKLPKTLDSILAQNFSDYEVVVIDGVSTDGTVEVIKKYEKIFLNRLRWISEKDRGIYEAMNKGVRMARGKFLNVVGAGDWLEADALKKISEEIEKNPQAKAFYGKTRIWNEKKTKNWLVQTLPKILPTQPMQHPALYYQKELHQSFGFYSEEYQIASDYLFCLKVFHFGKIPVISLDSVLVNFVSDGISSKKRWQCLKENWKIKRVLGLKNTYFQDGKNFLKAKLKNGK